MAGGPEHYRHAEEMADEAAERLQRLDRPSPGLRSHRAPCHAGEPGRANAGRGSQLSGDPHMAGRRRH